MDAEGEWTLVEEDRTPEPVKHHMDVRKQVDPTQLSKSRSYTENVAHDGTNEEVHFRVLRLERQMADLRQDVDDIKPKVDSLMTRQAAAKAVQPKPVHKTKAVSGGPLRVTGLRAGQHPGKARLVLDVSGAAKFSYDLDNNEKLLVIELPDVAWDTTSERSLSGFVPLKGYSAQKSGKGTRLVVNLSVASKIVMSTAMKPNHKYGHRVVFDIAPL